MKSKKKLIKICVLGAESTGTTTLAKDLAVYFKTCWVPEFGRIYCEGKISYSRYEDWNSEEFDFIAKTQNEMEDAFSEIAEKHLICDTNSFATRIWHERYMEFMSEEVDKIAKKSVPDLYILTGDEIPFVPDGLRDGEHIRHTMHKRFVEELERQKVPFIIVRGSKRMRLKKAVEAIINI